jgi:hypothetical protein
MWGKRVKNVRKEQTIKGTRLPPLRLSVEPHGFGLGAHPVAIMDQAVLEKVNWNHLFYRPKHLDFAAGAQGRATGGLVQHALDEAAKNAIARKSFVYPLGRAIKQLAEDRFNLGLSKKGEREVAPGGGKVDFPDSLLDGKKLHVELTCFSRVRDPNKNYEMPTYAEFWSRFKEAAARASPFNPKIWNKLAMLYVLIDLKVSGRRKDVTCHGVYLVLGTPALNDRAASRILRDGRTWFPVPRADVVPVFRLKRKRDGSQTLLVRLAWRTIDNVPYKKELNYTLEKSEKEGVGLASWIRRVVKRTRKTVTVEWIAGGTATLPKMLLSDSAIENAFFVPKDAVALSARFEDLTIFSR